MSNVFGISWIRRVAPGGAEIPGQKAASLMPMRIPARYRSTATPPGGWLMSPSSDRPLHGAAKIVRPSWSRSWSVPVALQRTSVEHPSPSDVSRSIYF